MILAMANEAGYPVIHVVRRGPVDLLRSLRPSTCSILPATTLLNSSARDARSGRRSPSRRSPGR